MKPYVKKHTFEPDASWEENYKALDEHHIQETIFLISKVRELAKQIDRLLDRV
jgi:hypothetical protein